MRSKIELLVNSNVSGYRINKDFPKISQKIISDLRLKTSFIDNITLARAEEMERAYDYYKKENML